MTKRQNASLMIKAIMLLLALIVMIFAASLAWFAPPDRPVNATGLSVKTSGSKVFDVAVGFRSSQNDYQYTMSGYSKSFNLSALEGLDGKIYDVLSNYSPVDITGDGVTLVRPSMLDKNQDIDRNLGNFTNVTPNKEYICIDLYFRSDEECTVYLDDKSVVTGAIENEPGDGRLVDAQLLAQDGNRKSSAGNFSKDAIVGAVRLSFVNYNRFYEGDDEGNRLDTARVLWLPRPDIHLNTVDSNKQPLTPWTLSTDVQPDEIHDEYNTPSNRDIARFADTYTHHYYEYQYIENEEVYTGRDTNYQDTVTQTNRVAICNVDFKSGTYYYGKTQVNLWIEGCDAESRRALAGGQFKVKLDLAGG